MAWPSPERAGRARRTRRRSSWRRSVPPVALKVESPDILHKSEAGALRLGVAGAAEARRAFDEVVGAARHHAPRARIDGVLVQEMVQGGTEMVVTLACPK